MQIIVHATSEDGSIAHETGSNGTFHIRGDGSIAYRPPSEADELFAAPSLNVFMEAVAAWQRYGDRIAQTGNQSAQAICIRQLQDDLARLGLGRDARSDTEFWAQVAEQTRDGLL